MRNHGGPSWNQGALRFLVLLLCLVTPLWPQAVRMTLQSDLNAGRFVRLRNVSVTVRFQPPAASPSAVPANGATLSGTPSLYRIQWQIPDPLGPGMTGRYMVTFIPGGTTLAGAGTGSTLAFTLQPSATNPALGTWLDRNPSTRLTGTYVYGGNIVVPRTAPADLYWGQVGTLRLSLEGTATTHDCPVYATLRVGSGTPSMTLTRLSDLDFGTILSGSTAGTVTISPFGAGSRTPVGVSVMGATYSRARFQVQLTSTTLGWANTFLGLSPDPLTLSGPGGGTLGLSFIRDLDWRTDSTLYVGGILSVGPNQPPGTYSGTFTATVTFY